MANTSSIPTGSAPLFLGDFASPLNAVTQRVIERKRAQLSKEGGTAQNKDLDKMLASLDFKAVEGLSQKVGEEHLAEVEEVQNKWSKRWIDSGKNLTGKDFLEMKRDKMKIEQDAALKKHNVAMFTHAQKELADPNNRNLYSEDSYQKLQDYVNEGNIGRDASDILKQRFNTSSYLKTNFKDLSDIKQSTSKQWDEQSPTYIETYQRGEEAARLFDERVANDETLQYYLQNPQSKEGQRVKAEIATYRQQLLNPTTSEKPVTSAMLKSVEAKNLPPKISKLNNKYGWMDKGLKKEDFGTVEYINDFAEKILRKDRATLNSIKSYSWVDDVVVNNDGDVVIFGKPSGKDKVRKQTTIITPNWENPDDVVVAKMGFIGETLPKLMSGKQIPDNIAKFVEAKWDTEIKDPVGNTIYESLKSKLSGDIKLDKNQVLTQIKALFDKKDIDVKTDKQYLFGIVGTNGVKWDGTNYDLSKKEDKNALLNKIEKEGEFAAKSTTATTLPPTTTAVTTLAPEPKIDTEVSKSIIDSYSKEDEPYPKLITDFMKHYGLTRSEAEATLFKDFGIDNRTFKK